MLDCRCLLCNVGMFDSAAMRKSGEGFPETGLSQTCQLWGWLHLCMKQLAAGAVGVRISDKLNEGLFRWGGLKSREEKKKSYFSGLQDLLCWLCHV